MLEDIDANIRKLLEGPQDVKYLEHIGGGHYISVTTGFRCVDFRRWFLPHDEQNPKPTKKGVALRLDEWVKMRNIVETIDYNHPSLASAIPCYLQEDHQNRMGALECPQMPPIPESADYVKRPEWHSYIDDTGQLHLCWRIIELIEQ